MDLLLLCKLIRFPVLQSWNDCPELYSFQLDPVINSVGTHQKLKNTGSDFFSHRNYFSVLLNDDLPSWLKYSIISLNIIPLDRPREILLWEILRKIPFMELETSTQTNTCRHPKTHVHNTHWHQAMCSPIRQIRFRQWLLFASNVQQTMCFFQETSCPPETRQET